MQTFMEFIRENRIGDQDDREALTGRWVRDCIRYNDKLVFIYPSESWKEKVHILFLDGETHGFFKVEDEGLFKLVYWDEQREAICSEKIFDEKEVISEFERKTCIKYREKKTFRKGDIELTGRSILHMNMEYHENGQKPTTIIEDVCCGIVWSKNIIIYQKADDIRKKTDKWRVLLFDKEDIHVVYETVGQIVVENKGGGVSYNLLFEKATGEMCKVKCEHFKEKLNEVMYVKEEIIKSTIYRPGIDIIELEKDCLYIINPELFAKDIVPYAAFRYGEPLAEDEKLKENTRLRLLLWAADVYIEKNTEVAFEQVEKLYCELEDAFSFDAVLEKLIVFHTNNNNIDIKAVEQFRKTIKMFQNAEEFILFWERVVMYNIRQYNPSKFKLPKEFLMDYRKVRSYEYGMHSCLSNPSQKQRSLIYRLSEIASYFVTMDEPLQDVLSSYEKFVEKLTEVMKGF